jgi:hypothetical protein
MDPDFLLGFAKFSEKAVTLDFCGLPKQSGNRLSGPNNFAADYQSLARKTAGMGSAFNNHSRYDYCKYHPL